MIPAFKKPNYLKHCNLDFYAKTISWELYLIAIVLKMNPSFPSLEMLEFSISKKSEWYELWSDKYESAGVS